MEKYNSLSNGSFDFYFLLLFHLKKPFAMNTVRGLSKSESKNALSLSTKEIYFIFNKLLYTQIDSVAMGSLQTPAIVFLCFMK